MTRTIGYAAKHSVSDLRPMFIERPEPGVDQVKIKISYCGVCHSDVHQVLNEWKNTLYPCMPGHEIIGRVESIGRDVRKFEIGDLVGVGCMIDSCGVCRSCKDGLEQYCEQGFIGTYNGNQRNPTEDNHTYGGYSESIVVREEFVLRIPLNLSPAAAAPLLCAGVTTYSPLRHWGIGPGIKVGVAGLGGLGQMAVKLARAMGADVTVLTSHEEKVVDALRLGATDVVLVSDRKQMARNAATLDFILSTIPQPHDPNPYIELLDSEGIYANVGCLAPLKGRLDMSKMNIDRKSVVTTLIGGIAETQEVLDFCGKHNIGSEIQVISIEDVNAAFQKVDRGEVDFRYVIDMSTLHGKQADESLAAKIGL